MERPPGAKESLQKFMERKHAMSARLGRAKRIIAVYSGKGGVGKTTVAVNLAVALAKRGLAVGLFDADIDCPNASQLLGCGAKVSADGNAITPTVAFGVKLVSMDAVQGRMDEARVWRGPMLSNAITELLTVTDWGDLDYLVIDFPPGTSDAPLTLMQLVPIDGFLIVTTPQALACQDAVRSGNMCLKTNQRIIGVVENMSGGAFGSGGGKGVAEKLGVPLIASIPLLEKISLLGDDGEPAVNDETVAGYFAPIVDALAAAKPGGLKVI